MKGFRVLRKIIFAITPVSLIFLLAGCPILIEPSVLDDVLPSVAQMISDEGGDLYTFSVSDLPTPSTLEERFSYTYGYMLYNTLLQQDEIANLNAPYFAKGALDANAGSAIFTADEMNRILFEVQLMLLQIAQQELEALSKANYEYAHAFLEENKTREGIITTESGLQYTVIEPSDGPHMDLSLSPRVRFTLTDGQGEVVDSAESRLLSLANLTPGFIEGLLLRNVGGRYRFWLAPDLTYPDGGESNPAGPNALLIADVTLLGLE